MVGKIVVVICVCGQSFARAAGRTACGRDAEGTAWRKGRGARVLFLGPLLYQYLHGSANLEVLWTPSLWVCMEAWSTGLRWLIRLSSSLSSLRVRFQPLTQCLPGIRPHPSGPSRLTSITQMQCGWEGLILNNKRPLWLLLPRKFQGFLELDQKGMKDWICISY